jgi:NAD(P)-dependent dehydrogenase (short-subunit alcohol dehydrogenase family)
MITHVIIFGGSSGIGLALAEAMLRAGAQVTIVGRSMDRLEAAQQHLAGSERLSIASADITHEEEVRRFFETAGPVNHIVSTAADANGVYQLLPSLEVSAARRFLDSKIIGALLLAKYGAQALAPGGSITLISGIAATRPAPRGAVVAAANGALESLVLALAVELAPIRINAVSPGWVDTTIWDAIAGEAKSSRLEAMAKRLPAGRIGRPSDIADAISAVMLNGYITGTVFHADGGQRLV